MQDQYCKMSKCTALSNDWVTFSFPEHRINEHRKLGGETVQCVLAGDIQAPVLPGF